MRGITRPCRHSLSPELRERWRSHLCGLCLTLRDEAGQAARVLTGYDMLIPSVLVEAQMGKAATEKAGPCPLRGMRSAAVIPVAHPGARLAAGASLLNGAAGLEDKLADRDVPGWTGPAVGRAAGAARRTGARLAAESGFEAGVLSGAATEAARAESIGTTLDDYLAPAGRAGGTLFAHTAVIAGLLGNEAPLRRAGDAFGRLVHLLDAVEDFHRDRRTGAFNPLAASGTPAADARRLARRLARGVRENLEQADLQDPDLARALLGPILEKAAERPFRAGSTSPAPDPAGDPVGDPVGDPRGDPVGDATGDPIGAAATGDAATGDAATDTMGVGWTGAAAGVAAGVAAALSLPAVLPGIFGGRRPWGRRPPPGYDPYSPPGYGYGYRRRGPSCCDLLACDCCANLACDDCCGDDVCCCCC